MDRKGPMIQETALPTPVRVSEVAAPPLAPTQDALDLVHLTRMTLGERDRGREVLGLFEQQAGLLLQRMAAGEPDIVATAAHTLNGSARGIGAWQVALAAEAVEFAGAATRPAAVVALVAAVVETRAARPPATGPLSQAALPARWRQRNTGALKAEPLDKGARPPSFPFLRNGQDHLHRYIRRRAHRSSRGRRDGDGNRD